MIVGGFLRGRYRETRHCMPRRKTLFRHKWSQVKGFSSITRSERRSRFPCSPSRHSTRTSRMSAWGMPTSFSNASHSPRALLSSPRSPSYAATSETAGRSWITTPCHGTSSSNSGTHVTGGSKPGIREAMSLMSSLYSRSWVAIKGAAVWMTKLPVFVTFAPAILLGGSVP